MYNKKINAQQLEISGNSFFLCLTNSVQGNETTKSTIFNKYADFVYLRNAARLCSGEASGLDVGSSLKTDLVPEPSELSRDSSSRRKWI